MDKSKIEELIEILNKYNVDDIRRALENCKPREVSESVIEEVKPKKKRGRPKKVKTVETKNEFQDLGPQTDEEKRIAKVSKELSKSKSNVPIDKRPQVTMVEAVCRNCHKTTKLPSNFPDLNKFVCCIPG